MQFARLVETSNAVAATRSRKAKIAALAELFADLDPEEIVPAVAFLAGEARQGRIGVGWSAVAAADVAPAGAPTLTIGDVDGAIDELAAIAGPGSAAVRSAALDDLLGAATAPEGDFIRRLMVGELRQGALEGIVVEGVARAAGVPARSVRRALMLSGDLGTTARIALLHGEPGLAEVRLEVLRAVQPMLASTATDVADAMSTIGGRAAIEWKLDGARIQVHRRNDEIAVFTRNLNDVTARLPTVVAAARALVVDEVVLDGEAMGFTADRVPHAFQDLISRFARDDGGDAGAELAPFFFDVLRLDGVDLLDQPLSARLDALERVAPDHGIPRTVTDDAEVGARVLAEAIAAGHEGVMVKALDSAYEAGRRGKAWRKVKPVHTLDLVVLAVEWGSGRRQGWLSNLHLGARDPDGGGHVMVGKTFKGLTDELLEWQTARFLELETERRGHVVHVRPEQVVEIALDGVQASTRYPGGVALRFARVRRYRSDKTADQADTIEQVRALLPRAYRAGPDRPR